MRLFIAVNFTEAEKDALMSGIRELKSRVSGGRFTSRDNLHLTLVFLGELPAKRLRDIKAAMNAVTEPPFSLEIGGLGRFRRREGDLFWLGVGESGALNRVFESLYDALAEKGFSLEDRKFTPHLTLGRQAVLGDEARQALAGLMPVLRPTVRRISLMLSERINGRLTYTELYGRDL